MAFSLDSARLGKEGREQTWTFQGDYEMQWEDPGVNLLGALSVSASVYPSVKWG